MQRAGSEPENHADSEHAASGDGAAFGKYQLFASLGRGGMADVFLAVARGPLGFNKLAVVKRLRAALADEPSFLNMFLDEARLAARLNHPNVVHTYEVGEEKGSYFIAMEYLEGQPLNKIIKEAAKGEVELDPVVSARIVSDALSGLQHAHELRDYDGTPLKIIHRDISPHNVFVTYDGQVKLVDFGIAKAALSSTTTEVGVLKGKVAYMAPEQAMGVPIDRRADIFAMGIVAWELLTRRRLMSGESAAATLHRLLNAPIQRVSEVVPGIDAELDAIVARALEKEPDARYQSAIEMRDALESWISKSGRVVRQEDVGGRVTAMFASVREDVRRQIQAHMGKLAEAANTQELASLNASALRRFNSSSNASTGQLLALGSSTGSGSGVITVPPAGVGPVPAAAAEPEPGPKKKRALVALLLLLAFVFLGAALLILRFATTFVGPAPAQSVAALETTAAPLSTPSGAPITSAPPTSASVLAVSESAPSPSVRVPTARPTGTFPLALTVRPTVSATPSATAAPSATAPEENRGPGFLTLDTYPWTRVSEGGRVLGTTPLIRLPLSPGPHSLLLENAEQGIKQSYNVVIKSGEPISRRLAFK